MKKLIIFNLFLSTLSFAQSSATISTQEVESSLFSRPENLKSLNFSLQGSYQNNPAKLDKEEASKKGITKDQLRSEVVDLNISSKWLFKPSQKLIFIDTINGDAKIHPDINSDQTKLDFDNQFTLSNDLVTVYVLSSQTQMGNLLHTSWNEASTFELNFNKDKIQKINNDHLKIQNLFFYQYNFNKVYSSRLNMGGKLLDYRDPYSSYIAAIGEEDRLETLISLENKFKINKQFSLKIPMNYRKEFYKNKIALNQNGTFNTSNFRPRETIEVYEFGSELSLNIENYNVDLSLMNVQQNDLNFGGRDFDGYRGELLAGTKINDTHLSVLLSFSDYQYENALVNVSEKLKWREKSTLYGAEAKTPLSEQLLFKLNAQKEIARDNYYAGKSNNEIYQMGLEFNL